MLRVFRVLECLGFRGIHPGPSIEGLQPETPNRCASERESSTRSSDAWINGVGLRAQGCRV